jgi:hypothetical protein
MRWKAILPAVLAVLLTGSCCVAPACQLVCDDAVRPSQCHRAVDDAMAGMAHCTMCVPVAAMAAAAGMACRQQVCAVEPASVGRANLVLNADEIVSPPLSARYAVVIAPRAGVAETPPFYRSTFISLHTILRV